MNAITFKFFDLLGPKDAKSSQAICIAYNWREAGLLSTKTTNDNIYAELLKYLIDEDALESFGNKKWFVQTVEEIVEHFENGFDSEFLSAEEYEIAKDFISTYKI